MKQECQYIPALVCSSGEASLSLNTLYVSKAGVTSISLVFEDTTNLHSVGTNLIIVHSE